MVGIVLSVVFATVPILGYLYLVWWLDRYDREPVGLMLLTFAWGAVGGVLLAIVGSILLRLSMGAIFGITGNELMDVAFVAPVVEEMTKGLFLLAVFARRDFDNTTDGVIYGAAAGLGFAMTENFLYFLAAYFYGGAGSWAQAVFFRTLFTGLMHAFATATLGASLGYSKYADGDTRKFVTPIAGLLAAIGIHAAWNACMLLTGIVESVVPITVAMIGIPVFGLLLLTLTQVSLLHESRTIEAELREECALGIIPEAHLRILPHYLKRAGNGWLPPDVEKRRYVPLATILAFRKFQRKRCAPSELGSFEEEIGRLRLEIRKVLNR